MSDEDISDNLFYLSVCQIYPVFKYIFNQIGFIN